MTTSSLPGSHGGNIAATDAGQPRLAGIAAHRLSFPRSSPMSTPRELHQPRRWALAFALAAAGVLLACAGGNTVIIPVPPSPPPACKANCPPPFRPQQGAHVVQTQHFSFWYFDPYQLDSKDDQSATVLAGGPFGTIAVQFFAYTVANGTTPAQLLARFERDNLDASKFSGLQDTGPIRGAEIGYIPGAGDTFAAVVDLPNAPNTPLFMQVMASTRGTTGIVFAALSPLDPQTPDPNRQTDVSSYDQMVNSVVWQ